MKCTLILILVTIGSLLTDLFAQYPVFVKDPYPYGSCLPDSALFAYLAKEDKVNDTTIYLDWHEQVIVGFKNVNYIGEVRKQFRRYPRLYIYEVVVDTILWLSSNVFNVSKILSYQYLVSQEKLNLQNERMPKSVMQTTKFLYMKRTFDLQNKKRCIVNRKVTIIDIDDTFYSKKAAKFIELHKKKLE